MTLAIFDVLSHLNEKNYFLYEQLNAEEQKSFHPLVLLKWMFASGMDPIKLQKANFHLFDQSKSQQFLTLATVGDKKNRRWQWAQKKGASDEDEVLKAIQYVYKIDSKTAIQTQSIFSQSELDEIIKEYRDDLKASTKEKKRSR